MLYIFLGTDTRLSGDKARSLVNSLRQKRPDAAFVHVNADDWRDSIIEEHLGGQGLFSSKYIIFLDKVTENAEAKEKIADFIPAMQESTNIFIVSEGKLLAELKKAFEKSAEKIVVTDEKAAGVPGSPTSGKKDFNIFALADAIGSRDKVKAWMIYRQAVDNGQESEAILGTIFWQVKSIIQAAGAKTAGEAGLSPFVFSKSKKYASNYSQEELREFSTDLIKLYHDGHRGVVDLELGIEKLLLMK